MNNLNMSIEDINNQMHFNCRGFWNNLLSTNCYAYALGIDIPEDKIIYRAYQPGTIGSNVFNIQLAILNKMSLEEKIYIDLKALNISFSECSQTEISCDNFENDFIVYQWIIALFLSDDGDYHFMKKSWDNIWWHKRGYNLENPINYDDNFETIYNPVKCELDGYKYVKCLKLNCKVKQF